MNADSIMNALRSIDAVKFLYDERLRAALNGDTDTSECEIARLKTLVRVCDIFKAKVGYFTLNDIRLSYSFSLGGTDLSMYLRSDDKNEYPIKILVNEHDYDGTRTERLKLSGVDTQIPNSPDQNYNRNQHHVALVPSRNAFKGIHIRTEAGVPLITAGIRALAVEVGEGNAVLTPLLRYRSGHVIEFLLPRCNGQRHLVTIVLPEQTYSVSH